MKPCIGMSRATWILGGAFLGILGGTAVAFDAWWASWIIWLVYFAVVEGVALFNSRDGDTLSEHVWAWFGVNRPGKPHKKKTPLTQLRHFILLTFMVWLTTHFLTGGWA